MSEKILRALMQLFAIGASLDRLTSKSRELVETFLRQQISLQQVPTYLALFDEHFRALVPADDDTKARKKIALSSVKMLRICTEINKELNTRQKNIVFLRLCEFIDSSDQPVTQPEAEFMDTVASVFNLEPSEARLTRSLSEPRPDAGALTDPKILCVHGSSVQDQPGVANLSHRGLGGIIWVLHLEKAGILFARYIGDEPLTANGQPFSREIIQVLTSGSVIRGPRADSLYFTDLLRQFMEPERRGLLDFDTQAITYHFKNGKTGLHPFSFHCSSGNLVGIMGSSGAGKSTLLSVLNGTARPSSGSVLINGIDLYADENVARGLIGNIPQDDLLMEDLTVFQNLFYNTKLCFGELDDWRLTGKVNEMLQAIGLYEARDLKVGDPLNKTISGGQRKRLNIALELIREPSILFVDEPTSGLSSRDAENVMDLLKQLALSGKLVFVVIHQPSSDIFKLFDRLLILDTGGYPVYDGNPVEALVYFRRQAGIADAGEGDCGTCGNINPEQIFNILEQQVVDEFGIIKAGRKVGPEEWYKRWTERPVTSRPETSKRKPAPPLNKIAGSRKQFGVFFKRDLLSKLANRQYLLINLLEAPVLALLLATLLRYTVPGKDYLLYYNENLPAYLFNCVIVALFLGLSVSAEEILRDRKIRKRESFLHLSRTSYLLSKVSLLFMLSAIQTISFLLIGNSIMGLQTMTWSYFLLLFSASCFSNMLGLNISSGMNSAVTVYILIPFLIIPQILLSGVIVRFEKLNTVAGSATEIPLVGNMMVSRWAYEGLAVHQFRDNDYNRLFFDYDAEMSRATYVKDYWVNEAGRLVTRCEQMIQSGQHADSLNKTWQFVIAELNTGGTARTLGLQSRLPGGAPTKEHIKKAREELAAIRAKAIESYNKYSDQKEKLITRLAPDEKKQEEMMQLMMRSDNDALSDLVNNRTVKDKVSIENGQIVQRFEPVYRKADPGISFFQSPFFAAEKNFFGWQVDTYYGNIAVIWAMTLLLYITLHFDILRRMITRK